MRFLSFFLLILLLSSSLIAQKQASIIFRVKHGAGKKFAWKHHIEGKHWPAFPKEDTLNASGEFSLPNDQTVAGYYSFIYKGRPYKLFVEPGRKYAITVDTANQEHPFSIDAADKEGQMAYTWLKWEFCQNVASRIYRQDTVFTSIKQKVIKSMDSCLQPFVQLNTAHKISKTFYTHAACVIKNYYASVLAASLCPRVIKTVYNKDSAGYDAAKVEQLIADWHEVEKIADLKDPVAMSTNTYYDYFYFYNTFYTGYVLYLKAGNQIVNCRDNSDQWYYNVLKFFTKEPLREYWMAVSLDNYILESRFQEFIPGLYKEFVKQYPRSRYIKYLTEGVENVKQFLVAEKNINPNHHFVQEADSISTVEELLSRFKGKTIYIDLWATWCGPCKTQFAFKNELDTFLKSKGVEVLYISIDRLESEGKWKNMIRFYNLEGYHIRASWKLTSNIYQVFNSDLPNDLSRNWGLSIPRYAICKDGKIIIDKAKQPGDKEELYKQIESVL
ncbi:MAG TPA: redoxin family protein [Niastella sp.]